jgi:hypothetical protein
MNVILPGTDVPGSRLLRPYGTVSVAVLNSFNQPEQIALLPLELWFFFGGAELVSRGLWGFAVFARSGKVAAFFQKVCRSEYPASRSSQTEGT